MQFVYKWQGCNKSKLTSISILWKSSNSFSSRASSGFNCSFVVIISCSSVVGVKSFIKLSYLRNKKGKVNKWRRKSMYSVSLYLCFSAIGRWHNKAKFSKYLKKSTDRFKAPLSGGKITIGRKKTKKKWVQKFQGR